MDGLDLPRNGNLGSITIQALAEALNGEQKRIQLPSFQRDAVWDEEHVALLWESIVRGFPIGSLLFSRVTDLNVAEIGLREVQGSRAEPSRQTATEAGQTEFVIIDGQQRSIAVALGLRTWQTGDSARLWIDLGASPAADGVRYPFYVCSFFKPWGVDATAAMQRDALQNVDPAALDERKRLKLDDDLLRYTWPVRATLPVPVGELLAWLGNGRSGDWRQLAPQMKRGGEPRSDLEDLFDRLSQVTGYKIPVFLAEALVPDDLGQVFHRLNRQGYAMSGEDLFFSALKMQWPQAHDLVWEIYRDEETGRFLQPTQIVHLAIRLVMAADGSDVVQLNNREFDRLVARDQGQDKTVLDRVRDLLEAKAQGSELGHLHHCLREARRALLYRPELSSDDPGLPVTLLARLRWRVWHTLAGWIYTHEVDEISRVEMIRYALMDHLLVKSSSSLVTQDPLRRAFRSDGTFPGFAIYAALQERGVLEPDVLTPLEYREQLCGDPDRHPLWQLLQTERELVMWVQRFYFQRWFDRFDPTLYKTEVDLPYDADHIVPRAHLNMRGRRYRLSKAFWEWRWAVLNNAGNFRYWPKALNRADGQKNLDGKYLLGMPDVETPADSYLRDIDLDTVGDVRRASFIPEEHLSDWDKAANHGGYAYDWTDPERMKAFRRATELRRVAMYARLYEQVGWGEWRAQMKLADQIRQYVAEEWIEPARRAGQSEVTVRSGDVHSAMGLENRMPAVCGALDASKFYEQADVHLIERRGPHQGATVEWVLSV